MAVIVKGAGGGGKIKGEKETFVVDPKLDVLKSGEFVTLSLMQTVLISGSSYTVSALNRVKNNIYVAVIEDYSYKYVYLFELNDDGTLKRKGSKVAMSYGSINDVLIFGNTLVVSASSGDYIYMQPVVFNESDLSLSPKNTTHVKVGQYQFKRVKKIDSSRLVVSGTFTYQWCDVNNGVITLRGEAQKSTSEIVKSWSIDLTENKSLAYGQNQAFIVEYSLNSDTVIEHSILSSSFASAKQFGMPCMESFCSVFTNKNNADLMTAMTFGDVATYFKIELNIRTNTIISIKQIDRRVGAILKIGKNYSIGVQSKNELIYVDYFGVHTFMDLDFNTDANLTISCRVDNNKTLLGGTRDATHEMTTMSLNADIAKPYNSIGVSASTARKNESVKVLTPLE